jgi:hypothetical protein
MPGGNVGRRNLGQPATSQPVEILGELAFIIRPSPLPQLGIREPVIE